MSRWCGNAVSRVTKWQRTGHEPMRPSLLQTPLILEAKDTALRRRGRAIHGCRASSNHASASEAVVPGSCAISRDEESSAGCHTAGEDGPLWNNEQCVGIQNAGTIAVRPESPSACKRRNVQRVRQGSRPVSAVHPRGWGLTLPSRGRATSGFASCRPPLMSNVSPQRVQQVHRASSVPARNAVLRTKRARAGDAPRWGEPSAHAVEAPGEGHGAEAPRNSKVRSSALGTPTLRKASRSARVCHSREKIEYAVSHYRRRRVTLE